MAQPSFTAADIATNIGAASSVRAADMDGDGDIDIIAAAESDDKIYWLENNGAANPSFTLETVATNIDGAWDVFPIDLDQDGDMDILSAAHGENKVRWFDNNGNSNPTFTSYDVVSGVDARSLFPGDYDNDGDIDVLSASQNDNKIILIFEHF